MYQKNKSIKIWVNLLSRVRLCATPWTVAYQAPLSMGFSRQEDINSHFSKKDIQLYKEHMKTCLASLTVIEMQVKNTVRYHLTLVRWPSPKNLQTTNGGEGVEKRGTLLHCLWECKLVRLLRITIWRFLKKLKIELPYDPTILLLGIYTEEIIIQNYTCKRMVYLRKKV